MNARRVTKNLDRYVTVCFRDQFYLDTSLARFREGGVSCRSLRLTA
jgi:hypothetical protein